MPIKRLLFTALAALTLTACPNEPPKPYPHAIMTPAPTQPPAVTLVDADGKPLTLDTLKGHYTWVYFGFANCPDVCPAAMSYMADEYKRLKHPDGVVPLFISVDPQRDKPEQLKKYAGYYHPKIKAATGEKAQIDTLAKALGAAYVIDAPKPGSKDYNVSHSNLVFVLDREGRYVATYVPGVTPGHLAEDFDRLTAN